MAALDAAVALAEVDRLAILVARDLHLHVAGAREQALDVDGGVAERLRGLGAAALPGGLHAVRVRDDAHPPPAAARDRLDDHARARRQRGEEGAGLVRVHRPRDALHDGHAVRLRQLSRARLVPEQVERFGTGSDEREARLLAGAREGGAFGEEAVAGVDGVAAAFDGGLDELGGVEVGGGGAPAQGAHGVGAARVQAAFVVLAVDGDGADAEFRRRAHDADGDLAAVGHEQAVHGHGPILHAPPTRSRAQPAASAPGMNLPQARSRRTWWRKPW